MPYASKAQERYFNYNKASKGKKLPERVKGSKSVDKHVRFKRQMKAAFPKGY